MPLKLTMSQARRRLTQLPAALTQGARLDVAMITDNGEPVLAILPRELYDSTLETLEILSDHQQMALLQAGVRDIAEGRTESWETVKSNPPLR